MQPMLTQIQSLMPDSKLPDYDDLYKACLEDCSVFETYEKAKIWFETRLEISLLSRLSEADIWQAEKDFKKRAEYYSISQVPTIIVRESYTVDANSAKNVVRLINIVDYLLKEVTNP